MLWIHVADKNANALTIEYKNIDWIRDGIRFKKNLQKSIERKISVFASVWLQARLKNLNAGIAQLQKFKFFGCVFMSIFRKYTVKLGKKISNELNYCFEFCITK
jgi:hypothetical protein